MMMMMMRALPAAATPFLLFIKFVNRSTLDQIKSPTLLVPSQLHRRPGSLGINPGAILKRGSRLN